MIVYRGNNLDISGDILSITTDYIYLTNKLVAGLGNDEDAVENLQFAFNVATKTNVCEELERSQIERMLYCMENMAGSGTQEQRLRSVELYRKMKGI